VKFDKNQEGADMFKVWDKKNRKFVIDNLAAVDRAGKVLLLDNISDGRVSWVFRYPARQEDYVVLRDTGWQDKSGRKIFEGDVVFEQRLERNIALESGMVTVPHRERIGVVGFSKDVGAWVIDWNRDDGDAGETANWDYLYGRGGLEVSGNVYEKSEIKS
jgi:uncharacterized phage protein (TIGR01671 family)